MNWQDFWNWLKALVSKLMKHSKATSPIIMPKSEESPKMRQMVFPTHNMPKCQPCPLGHGWKKRLQKTLGGASYWCNKCQSDFFVKANV